MRVERRGGPPDLEAAFNKFVQSVLRGRSLDDNRDQEAAQGRFPDFACFRDLVLIEMKHLETDQSDRLNDVFEKLVDPGEKPVFYGTINAQRILDKINNADQVKAAVASKLSRTIETHLSSANKQFAAYRNRHRRKNSVTICVILNSRQMEFSPELVSRAVHGKMRQPADGSCRFPDIDLVFYISEKHYQMLPDGRMAFPIGIFEGEGALVHPWKVPVVDLVMQKWSHGRTGSDAVSGRFSDPFDVLDDIPDKMARDDRWRLDYKRNPNLRHLSDDDLRVFFQPLRRRFLASVRQGQLVNGRSGADHPRLHPGHRRNKSPRHRHAGHESAHAVSRAARACLSRSSPRAHRHACSRSAGNRTSCVNDRR